MKHSTLQVFDVNIEQEGSDKSVMRCHQRNETEISHEGGNYQRRDFPLNDVRLGQNGGDEDLQRRRHRRRRRRRRHQMVQNYSVKSESRQQQRPPIKILKTPIKQKK